MNASSQTWTDLLWNGVNVREPIVMLGPSGTGKTSLLRAVVDTVNDAAAGTPIAIRPGDSMLIARFQTNRHEVDANLRKPRFANGPGTSIQDRVQVFPLHLRHRGVTKVEITFHDYAGALLRDDAAEEDRNEVERVLMTASVILVPVDATALMEADDRGHSWSDPVNQPRLIYDWMARILEASSMPRLVLFVPVKSETYLHHLHPGRDGSALVAAVKQAYQATFTLLSEHEARTCVAITPIETIGDVRFDEIRDGTFFHTADFENGRSGRYAPKDADQPMRYILAFAIAQSLETNAHVRESVPVVGRLMRWALQPRDNVWRQALADFSGGINTSAPFEIVQTPRLIARG